MNIPASEVVIGITDTGSLTGNGLIGDTRDLWIAVEKLS